MRRVAFVALGLLLAGSTLAGCSGILPRESAFTRQPWDDFAAAQAAFDAVVAHETTAEGLAALGLAPSGSPNVRLLSYVDLVARFLPHEGVSRGDLDPDLARCLDANDGCEAHEVVAEVRRARRTGNAFLDVFGFRKETHVTGWSFSALFVLREGRVVYKLRTGGEPDVDRKEKRVRPLGVLQEIDSLLVPAARTAM